jgi:DNA/RNA endonuclease YhcR with UshA esterase domain
MRMQKEEKTAVVLLLMALGSLAVAFWAFDSGDNLQEGIASTDNEGLISVEGLVMEMNPTKSGDNLIIELDSTPLPVFIPRDSGAEEILRRVSLGDRIQVNGVLWEYNDNKEIKLERSGDLKIIDM